MKTIINVALVGCGRVAGHHARSIDALSNVELVAVCDLVEDKAGALAKEHSVPAYTDYNDMLKKHPQVDVVGIITPSGMHFEHSLEIIEGYQKSVVIEKPMVMRLSQGRELKQAADKNGVQIFPVFQYRFNQAVQRVRSAVENRELGDLVLATVRTRWCRPQRYYDRDPWRGTFALDGGACTNQGIHHIDLLRYLAGDIKRVHARMTTMGADIEVEDTVVALCEFESGASGVLEITTAARPDDFESSISFVGSSGLAMIGGWATNELIQFSPDSKEQKVCSEEFPDVYGFGHKEIYRGIYRSLIDGGQPAVSFEDGMSTIKLLQAIYRSDEVGGWVEVQGAEESERLGIPDEKLANLYRTSPERVIKRSA